MFSRVRIAIRFFFVGLAVGVLLAPRSGEETRRIVRDKADRLLSDVLDAATLRTYESGAGATDNGRDKADAAAAPRKPRSKTASQARQATGAGA